MPISVFSTAISPFTIRRSQRSRWGDACNRYRGLGGSIFAGLSDVLFVANLAMSSVSVWKLRNLLAAMPLLIFFVAWLAFGNDLISETAGANNLRRVPILRRDHPVDYWVAMTLFFLLFLGALSVMSLLAVLQFIYGGPDFHHGT